MAISVFQNFGFVTPKISKNRFFFRKMIPKIQNFQNFQKTGTYVIHLLVVYQCTKFQVNSSIFDPQMECFCLRKHTQLWRNFFICDFCNFWGSYAKTNDTIRFLSRNWSRLIPFLSTFINLKIWPFLTWPFFINLVRMFDWADLRDQSPH